VRRRLDSRILTRIIDAAVFGDHSNQIRGSKADQPNRGFFDFENFPSIPRVIRTAEHPQGQGAECHCGHQLRWNLIGVRGFWSERFCDHMVILLPPIPVRNGKTNQTSADNELERVLRRTMGPWNTRMNQAKCGIGRFGRPESTGCDMCWRGDVVPCYFIGTAGNGSLLPELPCQATVARGNRTGRVERDAREQPGKITRETPTIVVFLNSNLVTPGLAFLDQFDSIAECSKKINDEPFVQVG
jgi:hypothetical protein